MLLILHDDENESRETCTNIYNNILIWIIDINDDGILLWVIQL